MTTQSRTLSIQACAFLAELLEDAEQTQSICEDVAPWCDRKPLIEELWHLYADHLTYSQGEDQL